MDPQSQAHPAVNRTRSRTSEDEWTRDSLDVPVLENNHRTNITEEDAITAADLPLPESIQTSSRQSLPDTPETVGNQAEAKYWEDKQRLQKEEPHLANVRKQSRAHDRASFELLDYNNGNLIATKTYLLGSTASRAAEDFTAAILNDVPANTDSRLLVVEDLSSKLIHVLHTCLGVGLEFFEEHLLNAGWHSNEYEDMGLSTWNTTTDFVKDYVSVRWLRPVWTRTRLHPSEIPDKWKEKISDRTRILHSAEPLVNILRLPWEAKLQYEDFFAWEERASVWSTQLGQCRIMVLLLDPMPVIRHTKAHVEAERYSRVLPQDLENGRSHIRVSIPGVSWFAQLLPRVFKFGTSGRMNDEAIPPAESRRESGSRRSAQRSVREDAQLADSYEDHCMFIGFSVRIPLTIYSDTMIPENKQRLAREMRCYSTTNTLKQLLQTHEVPMPHWSTPLGSLFQIIVHDTFKILQFIDRVLNDMDLGMLDDTLVQIQIDDWRQVLHKIDTELRTRRVRSRTLPTSSS